jgi:hypothetical protein
MNTTTTTKQKNRTRKAEQIGRYHLSVQASSRHDCLPRVDGLPLDQYTHLEVQLIDAKGIKVHPGDAGLERFNIYFHRGTAHYMAASVLAELRKALQGVA